MRRTLTTLVILSAAVFATTALLACSVPVFRYAYEQWNPDLFTLTVYHNGPLTEAQQELVRRLQPDDADALPAGNVQLRQVDISSPESELPEAEWLDRVGPGQAWLVAQTPAKKGPPVEVFSAEFDARNVDRLLDSPKRTVLTERLLQGQSAVWVLLESGNKAADDAAAALLTAELERLEKTLKLPEIDQKDLEDGLLTLDPEQLRIQFSLIRIARDEAAEEAFVSMLRATEPDLNDPQIMEQPAALPVFGRGRSLWALVGKGINSGTIEDTCRFLTGACQCTVKVQNPGVDLLTSVDWDSRIGSAPAPQQQDLDSTSQTPEYVAIAPGGSGTVNAPANIETAADEGTVSGSLSGAEMPTASGGKQPVAWVLSLGGFALLVAGVSLSSGGRRR